MELLPKHDTELSLFLMGSGRPLADATWTNSSRAPRRVESDLKTHPGRCCKSHVWHLKEGHKELMVPEQFRPDLRRVLNFAADWAGDLTFPWESTTRGDMVDSTVAFVPDMHDSNPDVLVVHMLPYGDDCKLELRIPSDGNGMQIEIRVQRKLPATLREILDKQGSKVDAHGLLVHHGVTQGGSLSYASSGLIQLPRPVDPAVYTKQLPHYSGGELELREELVTANAGSFNVGELLIKLKMAKDVQQLGEEQHASTFGRSPSPPRRRAV